MECEWKRPIWGVQKIYAQPEKNYNLLFTLCRTLAFRCVVDPDWLLETCSVIWYIYAAPQLLQAWSSTCIIRYVNKILEDDEVLYESN